MTLTNDAIHAAASERGGWSRAQLALLGVTWPPQRGWLRRLIGTTIEDDTYARFLALKQKPRPLSRHSAIRRDTTPDMFGTDTPESFANDMYEADRDAFS